MPLSKYNAAFGGKKGSAAKAHAAMVKQYGPDKGERVFYATKNKRSGGGRGGGGDRRQRLVAQFVAGQKRKKARRGR